ncbi:polysaccharide biosynthesis C-terminal domain-containing protein [soil metagenome]
MNKIKKLAGETVLYGLGTILPRTLNFFLVGLHTRIFLPDEYGVYVTLYAWIAFLNVIYLFGMETSYFRFATKPGADEENIFRVTQTFVLAISGFFSICIILFAHQISEPFDVVNHSEFIAWLSIVMFVDAAVAIPFARLRLEKKATKFAMAKILNILIQVGLNLYFLIVIYDPSINIGFLILANLFANLFYVIFFFKTLTSWRPAWDKVLFSSMIRYAYPIMLTGLAGMTNEMFSRQVLGWWLPNGFYPGKTSKEALGIFGACYRFSVIMNLAVQAFKFAAEPFFFSNSSTSNSPQLFAKVNHFFTIVCCFIVLGVTINLDILQVLLGPDFREGLVIVPILLIGYMFLGVYYNISIWFKLTDRTYFGTLITIVGMVLTIGVNFLLIPIMGYLGSAWATLICYLVMLAICYFLGQRYYPVPYKIVKGILYLLLALILIQISKYLELPNQIASTLLHAFTMTVYLAIAYWSEKKYWLGSID